MMEPFVISVVYRGTAQEFKARYERWGYTHRIAVLIGETTFTFEPDEEGNYRVLDADGTFTASDLVSAELLRIVAEKLIKLSAV